MEQKFNQGSLKQLQQELTDLKPQQIKTVLTLLDEGNTIPFIARYRKEMTGSLDEVQIREIEERFNYLENMSKRKEEVLRLIDEQGKLTPELATKIKQATKMQQLEDLYRPYKQKRRTKATIAKEKGLEPFALWLLSLPTSGSLAAEGAQYLSEEHELLTLEDVYAGAHEIIAEIVGDEAQYRTWIRDFTRQTGRLTSVVKNKEQDEKAVFEMYYAYGEAINKIVPHRILALNRGEKEDILRVSFELDEEKITSYLLTQIMGQNRRTLAADLLEFAVVDSYKRFIGPAIEREIRNELTEVADAQAIHIFGENLRNLLLQSPLKGRVVLGFDPAYRTGCKLAVVDATGKVLNIKVIYPHPPAKAQQREAAAQLFHDLLEEHQVEMVAIGNGTASRESELFVASVLKTIQRPVFYVIVSEAGASVYSASPIARAEFPELQVEERSAISIARRLQDPLAELVKIDPQAVGVGQYQHDVAQKRLSDQLDFVVETAVNQVGVTVNTASAPLLTHVSGLTKTTAQNIVTYREENGAFTNRSQLKKVPRLGPKAFEQAVGFLRIPESKNVLDNTGIHPESYGIAQQVLSEAQISSAALGQAEAATTLRHLDVHRLAEKLAVGSETLSDIIAGLSQPGRDLRDQMPAPLLRKDVLSMEDLKPGMELQGTVRNVVDFGAFVDIGVKQDGMVHISKLSRRFVKHPTDVVAVGDVVTVWVEQVDLHKGRIALNMLGPAQGAES